MEGPDARQVEQKVKQNQLTENQHYVWQKYLKEWTVDNFLQCYRRSTRRIHRLGTKSVGSDLFFYASEELTAGDHKFLDLLISNFATEELRELARGWITTFQMTYKLKTVVEHLPEAARIKAEEELEFANKMMGELLHGRIENKSLPLLAALREGDTAFLEYVEHRNDFVFFLFNQYFRTRKMRLAFPYHSSPIDGHDPRRTALLESIILSGNVGASLIAQWNRYRPIILINETSIPFITGDQPVLNLLGEAGGETGSSIEIYYPLSPSIAFILSDNHEKHPENVRKLKEMEVEMYNFKIYEASQDEIYSNDRAYLREFTQAMRFG